MKTEETPKANQVATATEAKPEAKAIVKSPREKYISLVKSEKLQEQMKASIADADPQFARQCVALTLNAATKNPALYNCTQTSIMKSMLDCCALGILPNGRDAHLIPYGQECQLSIDYKGMITLAMRSERISTIRSEIVCKNDDFAWTNGVITHSADFFSDRGEMIGVYAVATMKDGTEISQTMSKAEVDAIRSRSRSGTKGPWVTDYNEMAKKTVVRRLSKYLPLSPAAMAVIDFDDKQNFDLSAAPIVESTAKRKQSADSLAAALAGEADVFDATVEE